jgi:serine/threonine protein kinase
LEGRFFGGIDDQSAAGFKQKEGTASSTSAASDAIEMKSLASSDVQAEPMLSEDSFLTGANLCRWIIDYKQMNVGKEIGTGTFGTVYRGKWKGVDVAVKRFINQRINERVMLGFRAEVALLSELQHPNIVLFIGMFL